MRIVHALAGVSLLAASSAVAGPYAGLAGDTPNTGPEGTGNFVSGQPGNPAKAKSGRSAATRSKSKTSTTFSH